MTDPTIFLARHGETVWNAEGRRQGQLDSPLTAAGEAHARRLADFAVQQRVDRILVSPLGRARRTAAIAAERTGLEPVVVADLSELDHGEVAGLDDAELEARWPGSLEARAKDKYHWAFPGGESYASALPRAERALAAARAAGGQRVLVVSHEMIGRLMRMLALQLPVAEAMALTQPHGLVVELDPDGGHRDWLLGGD